MEYPSYYRYWGKAAKQKDTVVGPRYHLLVYHSLDVAAVGYVLLNPETHLCKRLAAQLHVDPEWLQSFFTFALTMHDLGKFFRAFQNLAPNLSPALVAAQKKYTYSHRHDSLGFSLWNEIIREIPDIFDLSLRRKIEPWLAVVCGHHGQPPKRVRTIKQFLAGEDELAACEFVRKVAAHWLPCLEPLTKIAEGDLKQTSWQLAGLAVLADWLGSDREVFKYHAEPVELQKYWDDVALPQATECVNRADLLPTKVNPFESIRQQFSFIDKPTPLQDFAMHVDLGGGQNLFILEDMTGAGKTEAAMVLVHRMMAQNLATGMYIGLPTMATANSMYTRLATSYRALFDKDCVPSLVLAHGARNLSAEFKDSVMLREQLNDLNYGSDEPSASTYCSQWIADSHKKALLADIGVGTIDQALLAVLPARHQSLRLFGLASKVLLVDEVHAYDPYMQALLTALLGAHAAQGGSAILLSATLPHGMRQGLINTYAKGARWSEVELQNKMAYPLVTRLNAQTYLEQPVATRDNLSRRVEVKRLAEEEEVLQRIRDAVKQGQCVCWIRNTVKDAVASYRELLATGDINSSQLTLFHSRFAMIDRQKIEAKVLATFGKDSSAKMRSGQVLIATQVVEQSLDLDFDVMVSDLAPVDLIIQRAGRLQRHLRSDNGDRSVVEERPAPVLYILAPNPDVVADVKKDNDWLKSLLPGTQAIYSDVGKLWLTIKKLLENGGFEMPMDARSLIEYVYNSEPSIPEQLASLSNEAEAKSYSERSLGKFNCLQIGKGYTRLGGDWSDEVNIPTRLGNDTVRLVLATECEDGLCAYAHNHAHEHKYEWPLSQLTLPQYEWKKCTAEISEQMQEQIRCLKEKTPQLKWLEVFPLTQETSKYYSSKWGFSTAMVE